MDALEKKIDLQATEIQELQDAKLIYNLDVNSIIELLGTMIDEGKADA